VGISQQQIVRRPAQGPQAGVRSKAARIHMAKPLLAIRWGVGGSPVTFNGGI